MKISIQQKLVDWESAFNSMSTTNSKDAKILNDLIHKARFASKQHSLSGDAISA